MPTFREFRRMLLWFVRRDAVRRSLDEEMETHIDLATRTYVERGMHPADARRKAEHDFGGRMSTRDATGDVHALRAGRLFDGLLHDLRGAARSLRHAPAFSLSVIAIFTLAIAANATIVGLVDRLLLRPPGGVTDPDRLVRTYVVDPNRRTTELTRGLSYLRYAELRDGAADVVDLALAAENVFVIGEGMNTQRVRGQISSANFFDVSGVRPFRGRFFTPAEAQPPDGADVMVISHGMWQRVFGASDSAIGQHVRLGTRQFTVIGIAPPDFRGIDINAVDLWIPSTAIRAVYTWLSPNWYSEHNFQWAEAIGRLRPGVSRDAAEQTLARAYVASLERQKKKIAPGVKIGLELAPLQLERGPNRTELSRVATWLSAVALIMLLIASANVANLFLTRAINRRRELSVRLALGVSRSRLITQLLAEAVLLSMVSAVLATVLAWWGSRAAVVLIAPSATPLGLIDLRMMTLTFVVTMIAALAGSLVPIVRSTRVDLAESMRSGVRAGTYQRVGLRSVLLVTQAALSVVLLIGAGLFVRSLEKARHARIGFQPENLLTVEVSARGERLAGGTSPLYLQFIERLRGMPGVEQASRAMSIPFGTGYQSDFAVPGIDSASTHGDFFFSSVDPSYFATTGSRIIEGRGFDSTDAAGAPLVAMVSESMAHELWPGQRAVGQCIRIGGDTLPCSTVVGVVENTHREGVRPETSHQYYVAAAQHHPNTDISSVLVRVKGDAAQMSSVIRAELQKMTPGAAYVRVGLMRDRVEPTLRPWRLGAVAFAVLGMLAIVIAATGLYSVITNVIAQRRHEFGVRMALGAQGRDVVRVALGEGLPNVAIGSVIGLAASAVAVRWIGALLFDVSPRDPMVFGGVVLVLALAAVIASLAPALRVLKIDPVSALRSD